MLLGKEPALRGKTTNDDDKRVARRIMSLRLCECVEMTRDDVIAWTYGVTDEFQLCPDTSQNRKVWIYLSGYKSKSQNGYT